MNPLKQLYKAVLPESKREEIWKWRHRAPRYWRFALLRARYRFIRKAVPRVTILFYPTAPQQLEFGIWKICRLNGYRITTDPEARFDLAVIWEDATWREADDTTRAIARRGPCLNAGCMDISKQHVQQVFSDVFGYALAVDPRIHNGLCVRKSDANHRHDGQIVTCPLTNPKPDCVYQKLINNRHGESSVEEIRVSVFGSQIPFVCLKYRHIDNRFRDYFGSVLRDARDIFTDSEIKLIGNFCCQLKLDYGELDVLRDIDDGRIYIVDANNTPTGPPRHLSKADEWRALRLMAETFAEEFVNSRTDA